MIIVDVETTGLDPSINSIVSIGALDFNDPENTFYGECRIWEGAVIDMNALRINGFTEKQIIKNPKSPKELLEEFIKWAMKISDREIGGYYTRFDYSFLISTADRFNVKLPLNEDVFDLHTVFAESVGVPKELAEMQLFFTLDEILMSVGVPPEPSPHNGLRGARYTAEGISRFMKGEILLEEFRMFPIPSAMKGKK